MDLRVVPYCPATTADSVYPVSLVWACFQSDSSLTPSFCHLQKDLSLSIIQGSLGPGHAFLSVLSVISQ
jgi:hypothetical protein